MKRTHLVWRNPNRHLPAIVSEQDVCAFCEHLALMREYFVLPCETCITDQVSLAALAPSASYEQVYQWIQSHRWYAEELWRTQITIYDHAD